MKFKLSKASDYKFKEEVNIDGLDDLENLYKKYAQGLIIAFDDEPEIVIYDDYLE